MIESLDVRCPYCNRLQHVDVATLPTFSDGTKTIFCPPPCGLAIATIQPDGSFLNRCPTEAALRRLNGTPEIDAIRDDAKPCDFEIVVSGPAGGGGITCPGCRGRRFEPYAEPGAAGIKCTACGYFIGGGEGAPGGHDYPATGSNGQAYGVGGGGGGGISSHPGGGGAGGTLDPAWEAYLNGTGPNPYGPQDD